MMLSASFGEEFHMLAVRSRPLQWARCQKSLLFVFLQDPEVRKV